MRKIRMAADIRVKSANVRVIYFSVHEQLKASLQEAVEIEQGSRTFYRVTRYEIADVKAIRASLNVLQVEFAKAFN